MFQNLPLPATQEVRDSSSVTPCIVMKNVGVLNRQVSNEILHHQYSFMGVGLVIRYVEFRIFKGYECSGGSIFNFFAPIIIGFSAKGGER